MNKIFETHAHFDDEQFDEDRVELLNGMPGEGIAKIVNVGANIEGSKASVVLASEYDHIYAAVGVHPSDVDELNDDNITVLKNLLKNEKVVAVGEIGLDYHYEETDKELQKFWFKRQIALARDEGYPMIIHSRDAAFDTLEIMKSEHAEEIGGVIHCFSYSVEMAREYLNMGFYIGVGGVVTFKNAKKLIEVVKETPIERIVLETDSPYLAPVPHRGKRNDSRYLSLVASEIARIKDMSYENVINNTWENAHKLYRMN